GNGGARRGTGRHLPLAQRDRGVPLAHRHLAGRRAGCALRTRFDARPGHGGVPLLPDPRRRGDRGGDPGGRFVRDNGRMTIQVQIPTILRSYTGGEKAVEGKGDTLADLFADVDSRHPGLRQRLVDESGGLHRFVNVYVNDEDVRFIGGLETPVSDGDKVTVLPAV